MKKLLFPIFLLLFVIIAGCDSPEKNGVVELDGPILESIDADGNLEFNGAVINTSDQPVRSVYVVIVLKDKSGNIMEANSVSLRRGYERPPLSFGKGILQDVGRL